jgi:NAD(P)H dehydrogenase (quinone)
MKIAVTAASGHLGAAIIKKLVEIQGADNVIAIARSTEKAESLDVEVRKGDYDEKDHFIKALKDIDAVLLVSGMAPPDKRIQQHRNVLNAAKLNKVKKIVYTSIIGPIAETDFAPIVNSNRQTEEDIRNSGLEWVIGRNGLYIEPDVEYIDEYKKEGKISNCAGDGKCAYTTRDELATAYTMMLLQDHHNGCIYNLTGEPISQAQLVEYMNQTFHTDLIYELTDVDKYRKNRIGELGEFLGTIIAGIYNGIRLGYFDVSSDFSKATEREHMSWIEYFKTLKEKSK